MLLLELRMLTDWGLISPQVPIGQGAHVACLSEEGCCCCRLSGAAVLQPVQSTSGRRGRERAGTISAALAAGLCLYGSWHEESPAGARPLEQQQLSAAAAALCGWLAVQP